MKNVRSQTAAPRRGVTLTEVLMSMFIMALGVVFVATLFPASVLRSIEASQMTSATILRYNAESAINVTPGLVHDPDGDLNMQEHFIGADPETSLNSRNFIVDPLGYYVHLEDGSDPDFSDASTVSWHAWFGSDVDNTGQATATLPLTRRYDGGIQARNLGLDVTVAADLKVLGDIAEELVYSRDRWNTIVDVDKDFTLYSESGDDQYNGVTFPNGTDLAKVVPGVSRVRVYDIEGFTSQSYPVESVDTANNRVVWDSTALPNRVVLPPAFSVPDGVSRIVLENDQRLFSWFLTVRKDSDGRAKVDVVVTFNRKVDPKNERAYSALFVPGQEIVYANSGGFEPFLKKGGYVFDIANAEWYRIRDFIWEDNSIDYPAGSTAKDYDIKLNVERAVRVPGSSRDLDSTGGSFDGFAIFMPGIVDVFPIGSRALPEFAL